MAPRKPIDLFKPTAEQIVREDEDGPDMDAGMGPAERMAAAFMRAISRAGRSDMNQTAVEQVLADDLRAALESYR